MLAKKNVLLAIEQMPEQLTYEQAIAAIDELQFVEDTKLGLDDVANGKIYAAEDVFRELNLQ